MSKHEQIQEHLKQNQYTWLVTGIAKSIGSNLLETLLKLDKKVIGLDNLITSYQQNIDQALEDADFNANTDHFHFITDDICNLDDCRQACKGVDYVLHQAALGSVPRSIEGPFVPIKPNINGFLNHL
jgi:UDP-N-acetylglucosamine 4-epimerase